METKILASFTSFGHVAVMAGMVEEKSCHKQLRRASSQGDLAEVSRLLEAVAHPDGRLDGRDFTALHYAALYGHNQIVDILISRQADVNAVSVEGRTPLHMAASGGWHEVVERLVKSGARVDSVDHAANTALHDACHWGHLAVVKLLVDTGQSLLTRRGHQDQTPREKAQAWGYTAVADYLQTMETPAHTGTNTLSGVCSL